MTTGQILQEEKKIKDQQKKKQDKLDNLEINLRDSAEFNNWKRVEEQKEAEERVE